MTLGNIGAVFFFEWRRALTVPRIAWWAVLTLFPVFIVLMVRMTPAEDIPREFWSLFLFALVPMLISTLGTFLWTTSAVSAELERESWIYIAVRPGGRTAMLLGKYLAAVAWVLPAALVALTGAVGLAQTGDTWRIWSAIACITCLSVPAYAAVYLALGTLFPKRAMVVAVAYTLVFELVISMVPALINKLTVQYRLRALLVDWAEIEFPEEANGFMMTTALLGDAPAWWHVAVLTGYTFGLLVTAVLLVRVREYETAKVSEI